MPQKSDNPRTTDPHASVPQEPDDELEMADDDEDFEEEDDDFDDDSELEDDAVEEE